MRFTAPTSLAQGVPDVLQPLVAPIDAGLKTLKSIVLAPLQLLLGDSLSHVQCAPGNPDYPACAIPGGSAAALVKAGVAPDVVASVVAYATENQGIGGGGSGGMRIYRTN